MSEYCKLYTVQCTLTKTHKIPMDVDISTLELTDIEVRPIISCSGSPIEKLSILATKIITPPLKFCHCRKHSETPIAAAKISARKYSPRTL